MQDNHRKMLNIGFFNDYYRETLKGGSGDSALKDKAIALFDDIKSFIVSPKHLCGDLGIDDFSNYVRIN